MSFCDVFVFVILFVYILAQHQDVVLQVLPSYHIYGLSVIMLHKLSVGAKLITLPGFQPKTFLESLEKYKINLLYAVPPIGVYLFMLYFSMISRFLKIKKYSNTSTIKQSFCYILVVTIFVFVLYAKVEPTHHPPNFQTVTSIAL